jgi:hypothetical protein
MNPHQKNKVDVSVRTAITSNPSLPLALPPTNPPLTQPPPDPHRRRAKALPPLRQTPLQKRPGPTPAERAQILRLRRLRPVQSRQIRQRPGRRPRPRPPLPRHHPAPLAASLQLWLGRRWLARQREHLFCGRWWSGCGADSYGLARPGGQSGQGESVAEGHECGRAGFGGGGEGCC